MKNIFKILSLVVFVLLMASCQKENDVLIQENETENQFKCAEEEEFNLINNPNIHGQISFTLEEKILGISIDLEGQTISYHESTSINDNGDYSFIGLAPGTYKRSVIIGGQISSTTTYLVTY